MKNTDPRVDAFLDRATQWQDEFRKIRQIALDCPLTETVKWGVPCYTVDSINVVIIHGFK